MEFRTLLAWHSLIRWIVLVLIILVLLKSYKGLKHTKPFSKFDTYLRVFAPIFCWIQLILGGILYSKSSIVSYFFNNLPETLSLREIRFFGIEHSTVMPIAICLITIGAYKSYKHSQLKQIYRLWFKWTIIAFVLIITSIPWSFWPLVSRPLLRSF